MVTHGDSIAFERGGWVWLVLADGGPPQRHVRGTAPAWSPDGRRLAFARSGRIGVINVETGRVQLIARGRFGAWSRTGRQLAFTAVTKDGTAIYIADVTGTRMRSVIAETSADVRVAGYSSDGTRLLYVRVARP